MRRGKGLVMLVVLLGVFGSLVMRDRSSDEEGQMLVGEACGVQTAAWCDGALPQDANLTQLWRTDQANYQRAFDVLKACTDSYYERCARGRRSMQDFVGSEENRRVLEAIETIKAAHRGDLEK